MTTFTHFTHPPPPLATTNLFSVSISSIFGFCLHFKFPYKSEVRVFVFLCLTYFINHNALEVHPCFLKWQDFILFNDWIIFHLFIYASVNTGCFHFVVVVQSLNPVRFFMTSLTAARQASLSFTISQSLLQLIFIVSVMLSKHIILFYLLLLLPSLFPSIKVFSNELAHHIRWPKYWSFSFSTSPSNEYLGLISFRIGWFDLLAVQGTFTSLLGHHILKASVLYLSSFFTVHLSHPYMTTGKAIALTIWTFVFKVMSLLFNTLSRFVIAFLPYLNYCK